MERNGAGAPTRPSRASIFDRYVDAGGNFVDTADGYQGGQSEQMCGKFINDRKLRDQIVLATKFTFNGSPGNPNSGGNGRKNIYRAIDASLRRLNTDFVDLYWLHAWDTVTPVEEVVYTLTDLVRAGKIRHYGFSDTPAWYVARAHTLAEQQGKEGVAALQLEYSLIERNIEREHIPAAQELGIRHLSLEPAGRRFPDRQIQAPRRHRNRRRTPHQGQPVQQIHGKQLAHVGSAAGCEQGTRKIARPSRHSVGGHATRHHVHHPGREQPGAAQRQPCFARIQPSRRIFASAWTKPPRWSPYTPTYSSAE